MRIGLIALVLLAAASLAAGQEFDRARFFLRDIRGTIENLESIYPQQLGPGAATGLPTDTNSYQMVLDPGELISLRRNFTRSLIDNQASPLDVAFVDDLKTEASLTASKHLAVSFKDTETRTKTLEGLALTTTRVKSMGLTQTFGKGESASGLSLYRNVTSTTPLMGLTSTTKEIGGEFKSGLTSNTDLLLKAMHRDINQVGGYEELDLLAAFTVKLPAGDAPLGFARNKKVIGGVETLFEKVDMVFPFKVMGGAGILEHHSQFTEAGPVLTKTRTTHFAAPFQLTGQPGSVDYSIFGENKGAGMVETRRTAFVNPFKIGSRLFGMEETLTTVEQTGLKTDTFLTKLTAPLFDGQAVVQHQTVRVKTPAGKTEQEQVAFIMPVIKVSDRISVQAQRVSTENEGTNDQDVTNFNLNIAPSDPWTIDARYQVDDKGPMAATKTRQVHTKYTLRPNLLIEGHLTEAETPGLSRDTSVKLLEVTRPQGESALGLKLGFASFGAPNVDIDSAKRFEVCWGKAPGLAVVANYSEYDPGTWARYLDDKTVALAVQHGDPNDFFMRWRYEDQPTRIEPLQVIDVGTGALGGTLAVSYQNNPLVGPANAPTVRQADQYEATLKRKIFGDGDLEVCYRYVDYNLVDQVDQNLKLVVGAGDKAKSGRIDIGYTNGEYVAPGNPTTPGSQLDLSYEKLWGPDGKLRLTVNRKTAPMDTLLDGSVEGALEFSKTF